MIHLPIFPMTIIGENIIPQAEVPFPEYTFDTTIVRTENYDAFVRRVDGNDILRFKLTCDNDDLKANTPPIVIGDELIEAQIQKENVTPLIRGTVAIVARFQDSITGEFFHKTSSGAVVSDRVVFTCKHTFVLDKAKMFDNMQLKNVFVVPIYRVDLVSADLTSITPSSEGVVTADVLDVEGDAEIWDDECRLYTVSDTGLPWFDYFDFVVLQLHAPLINAEAFTLGSDEELAMLPIAACGFPGREFGERALVNQFTNPFLKHMERTIRDKSRRLLSLRILYRNAFFDFKHFVVSFGTAVTVSTGVSLVEVTLSTSPGMSGGPVIDSSNPGLIRGILLGGCKGYTKNVFLSARHPAIVKAYRKYCG